MATTLYSIDCQARAIGGYGYGALADPGSSVATTLTLLVTIFIALFGLRLLFGPTPQARDVVGHVVRIGLVLTIATAWPAWRTVAYDLVLDGPVEVARAIGVQSGLPESDAMLNRLQDADNGIILATIYGSGRLTGGVSAGADIGDATSGIALSDSIAFGISRTAFLASTIGSFAVVRLCAGILLALAPLMAGLALFNWTIGVFTGWLRALAFCALGSLMLLICQGAMMALLFPWLNDVLKLRQDNVLAASAPTELLALTMGFAILTTSALILVARLTFFSSGHQLVRQVLQTARTPSRETAQHRSRLETRNMPQPSRAELVANALEVSTRQDRSDTRIARSISNRSTDTLTVRSSEHTNRAAPPILGDSFRRNHRRTSVAAGMRNTLG
ncbi:type IV secretion system protein [Sphingomonas sp. PP-F2F-G114-C0414]|uniref:type IV secretion system protein n=1 Tax=Sphingomonas sp. PP-F2F-G114-C0414 TaxID=2135662 RepID=UPI001604AEFA|nr:type IV secretion system protein [Sphingomonas sp. PP-F2F-G114-C0414]